MAPKFGTSGLRGLVSELTDGLCADYTRAFLAAMGDAPGLMIGRDLRPSSPRIAAAVAAAALGTGLPVVDLGELPTPALALAALARGWPSVMVTGSHIPADRNGLKFYSARGEITKADEAAILGHLGRGAGSAAAEKRGEAGADLAYLQRYTGFFAPGALAGLRIGVYQHSSVGRDLLVQAVTGLGATALPLGRSDSFIPVDTEAVSAETRGLLRGWAQDHRLDAIISADGDADRPLLTDAAGEVVAGDILGVLTAIDLGADLVVTPVSSNSMAEATGAFARVLRTKIGSPFVIAGIEAATGTPCRPAGYEANGGFLLGFPVARNGRTLTPLLTRDGFLPILSVLTMARARGLSVAALVDSLPARRTASDRLEDVATERSLALVATLTADPAARAGFFDGFGPEAGVDLTDGLRVTFADGLILHLRPSGNAPELRCYAEAADSARAEAALRACLARARARIG